MLERINTFLLALVLAQIVALGALTLAPPSPQVGEQATTQQQSAGKTEKHGEQVQSLWVPVDSVGLYTLVLAVFTGVLATVSIFQGVMLMRADKTARLSAEAARLNAEALISAERANLFVIIKTNNLHQSLRGAVFYRETESMQTSALPRPELEFVIKNTGRTAAIMQDVSYQLVQAAAETRMWNFTWRDTIVNAVVEGGIETAPPTPCIFESNFTIADGVAAIDSVRPLFFYGFVSFRDTFKRQYDYFWRYEYRGNRFVLVHEEEHQKEAES